MKPITRRGFVGAAALSSTVALAACSSDDATATAEDGTEGTTELTFVLDYTPNTNHTGIYVAIDKGYYEEEGLTVSVVQPPEDGADAMVGSGQAPLGMSYQDVMANYLGSSQPLPVTAIAAVIQHNTSGIISRQGDGITHPAGLEGKRYGTWDQAVEQAMVKSVVETDGGDFDEVTLVPANSADEISGLKADMFDAIWCFEAWAGQNAVVQDYPVDYWSFISIDDTFDYYTPVIIANDAWLAENGDVAKKFLAATAKGYEYAQGNPDDAADILVKLNPEIDSELAKASQEYLADKYTADASQWGVFDADRWNKFYEWMNEEGLVEVEIPDDTGFTNEYLPAQS
jgi:ABC-type nitrate/sulfonate/bicarbonate transport system substrate-binding protein